MGAKNEGVRESGKNPEQSCCRIDLAMLHVLSGRPLGILFAREGEALALKGSEPEDLPRFKMVLQKTVSVMAPQCMGTIWFVAGFSSGA